MRKERKIDDAFILSIEFRINWFCPGHFEKLDDGFISNVVIQCLFVSVSFI